MFIIYTKWVSKILVATIYTYRGSTKERKHRYHLRLDSRPRARTHLISFFIFEKLAFKYPLLQRHAFFVLIIVNKWDRGKLYMFCCLSLVVPSVTFVIETQNRESGPLWIRMRERRPDTGNWEAGWFKLSNQQTKSPDLESTKFGETNYGTVKSRQRLH